MSLAIFDLDNTLLAGDSDHLWGCFLSTQGIVDAEYYARENERFYREYEEGTLDIHEFLRFSLRPLRDHPRAFMEELREHFVHEYIDPIILPAARALVEGHRAAGDTLLIITATNSFVAAPIAGRFGIPHLIATVPAEDENGEYTGEVTGTPSFRDGKVKRLEQWLRTRHQALEHSVFYSDSVNDVPLLERVTRAVAVDPDPRLRAVAQTRDWEILTLRQGPRPCVSDARKPV